MSDDTPSLSQLGCPLAQKGALPTVSPGLVHQQTLPPHWELGPLQVPLAVQLQAPHAFVGDIPSQVPVSPSSVPVPVCPVQVLPPPPPLCITPPTVPHSEGFVSEQQADPTAMHIRLHTTVPSVQSRLPTSLLVEQQ